MENTINEILAFSECCCEQMSGEQLDHEVCPCCGEHCEVVYEDWSCWKKHLFSIDKSEKSAILRKTKKRKGKRKWKSRSSKRKSSTVKPSPSLIWARVKSMPVLKSDTTSLESVILPDTAQRWFPTGFPTFLGSSKHLFSITQTNPLGDVNPWHIRTYDAPTPAQST